MPEPSNAKIHAIDWPSVLPWVRLFESFRLAIHPPKLLLALLLVILVFLVGTLMDQVWPVRVLPGEVEQFTRLSHDDFDHWRRVQSEPARIESDRNELVRLLRSSVVLIEVPRKGDDSAVSARPSTETVRFPSEEQITETAEAMDFSSAASLIREAYAKRYVELEKRRASRQSTDAVSDANWLRGRLEDIRRERDDRLRRLRELRPAGVFDTGLSLTIDGFERVVRGAVAFNFGLDEIVDPPKPARIGASFDDPRVAQPATVVSGIRQVAVTLPAWLWHAHPVYMIVFGVIFVAIWALLGGAISRIAATHAARDQPEPTLKALRFAFQRWAWFMLTPIIPLVLVLLVGLALAAGGLLFNIEVLDVLASLVFFLALAAGAFVALVVITLLASSGLLLPAVAVEGTDAFDAISRAFSYVINRPWRWAFYNGVAIVYGAITYVFVGVVVFLALVIVHQFAGAWVFRDASPFLNRFDGIMPTPEFGELAYAPDLSRLPWTAAVAAVIVSLWVNLFIAMLAAYAISYLLSSQTWVYLLLRRAMDGTDVSEVYTEPVASADNTHAATAAPDEAEPPADAAQANESQ